MVPNQLFNQFLMESRQKLNYIAGIENIAFCSFLLLKIICPNFRRIPIQNIPVGDDKETSDWLYQTFAKKVQFYIPSDLPKNIFL